MTAELLPLVSCVIPVYNGGRWLAETLDSVLAQTYRNCEILVVDDGSTDDSAEVASRFAGSGDGLVRKANGGTASARNLGVARSRGELIAFLDADDL
jgi:glycosyltransferase involved in cell wall biosynthesis